MGKGPAKYTKTKVLKVAPDADDYLRKAAKKKGVSIATIYRDGAAMYAKKILQTE